MNLFLQAQNPGLKRFPVTTARRERHCRENAFEVATVNAVEAWDGAI